MQRYVALDGLRGIAAISVVLLHLQSYGLFPPSARNHAVDLFFIMSGFVIAAAYQHRLAGMGWWEFLKVRLIRLYPAYALSLTITPLFLTFIWAISRVPVDNWPIWLSLPFQALYLPSPPAFVPGDRSFFLLNGPGWSLLWEIAVNILYALFHRHLTARVLAGIVALAAAALVLLWFGGVPLTGGSAWPTWYVGPVRVLFGFPLGLLLYRLRPPPFRTPFVLLAAMAGASLFLPELLSLFVLIPLICWLAVGPGADSALLRFLGELSYPLYAVHEPMFGPFTWAATRVLHWQGPAVGLVAFLGALVSAWAVLKFWDEPVRRHLAHRRRRRLAELTPAF